MERSQWGIVGYIYREAVRGLGGEGRGAGSTATVSSEE
jgi:hypothetical protein